MAETQQEKALREAQIASTTDEQREQFPQQKEYPMATAFFPLNGLKAAVKACRDDLSKVRALNSALSTKVKTLNNKSQFAQSYIVQQSSLLRQDARGAVEQYLIQQDTLKRFQQIESQKEFWSPRSFLLRGLIAPDVGLEKYDEAGNMAKLMKGILSGQRTTNALLSVAMLPVSAIEETCVAALMSGDMQLCASAYGALVKAGDGGDDISRRAANRIEAQEFPAVKEATDLLGEARRIEELLGYSIRSISSGDEDLGLRTEEYARQDESREAARVESRAQEVLDAEAAIVRSRMDGIRPAA